MGLTQRSTTTLVAVALLCVSCGSEAVSGAHVSTGGYFARSSNAADFLQLTVTGDQASGDLSETRVDNGTLHASHYSVAGTIAGGNITLTLDGHITLSGQVQSTGIVLNVPQVDGTLASLVFSPSSSDAYNAAVAALRIGETTTATGSPPPTVPPPHSDTTAQPTIAILDQAGVLTSDAIKHIQVDAEPFVAKHIPVIVLIRRQATTADGVVREAEDVLRTRSLESVPGARDGIVILIDLDPADGLHGRGAIAVGARLSPQLDGSTLSAVYSGSMVPRLSSGDFAGAVSNALSALSARLGTYRPYGA